MNGKPPLPWKRSLLWLLFLGPFFFLSYGQANQLAASRETVASLYFAWERQLPFLPWTIVPYWSIDLLYGLSFLCCRDARAVDRHGQRLLAAQVIAVACFLAFPLRFAFARPATDGLAGAMFTALSAFDQPYNQAPSLHIALLVLIWFQFAKLPLARPWRLLVHGWALLIGISVLTTWQHHFIDVPTGAALGLFCLWLLPEGGLRSPLRRAADAGHFRLAAFYGGAAAALLAGAIGLGGLALALAWPALSLLLVAWNYAWAGSAGFQKQAGGHSLAARWLFAPYQFAAWLNSRWWTRRHPAPVHIAGAVWLGRMPDATAYADGGFGALVDLSAELPAPRLATPHHVHPCLDLVPAAPEVLGAAAREIARRVADGPVLVACALGYSRSAAAVAAWLKLSGQAADTEAAIRLIREQRPQVVLDDGWRASLAQVDAAGGEPA